MIKVAYFDLGHSREQYGLVPTRYGGGGVAARFLKQEQDIEFHIFARDFAFDNLGPEDKTNFCHIISEEAASYLKSYHPLDRLGTSGYRWDYFDIILHPHTCESMNRGGLKIPLVHFCGFSGTGTHPGNDYVLLYDDSFRSIYSNVKEKYVRIGKPVPKIYTPHPKADYIFQCTRQDDNMNSIEVAKLCQRFSIRGYFAGPIHSNYPILDYIDNKVTFYLGEIDENTKLSYCRHARLFTLPLQWDAPFSQSVIEAQSEGTPLWAYRRGPFLKKYLIPDLNGFDAFEVDFLQAFNRADRIKGKDCWLAAKEYDVSVMVNSFKKALNEIVEEWRLR